jgi:hypothetical protein
MSFRNEPKIIEIMLIAINFMMIVLFARKIWVSIFMG